MRTYLGVTRRDSQPMHVHLVGTLLITQLFLMGWVETKRWYDLKNPGSQADGSFLGFKDEFKGTENGYPGKLSVHQAGGPVTSCLCTFRC